MVSKLLENYTGKLFNDYYIVDENGKSHQIDHILVCNKGIIIVETKNYSGRIYGDDNQREWTQVLKYGKVKNKLYNPIKQNNTHLYFIGKSTSNKYKLIPLVIFVQGNIQYIKSDNVFSLKGAKLYLNNLPVIYSDDEVNQIALELETIKNIDVTKKEHINSIKKTLDDVDNNICPRCGKNLVLRNGKNGDFYGCSGYPYCKFTKKI